MNFVMSAYRRTLDLSLEPFLLLRVCHRYLHLLHLVVRIVHVVFAVRSVAALIVASTIQRAALFRLDPVFLRGLPSLIQRLPVFAELVVVNWSLLVFATLPMMSSLSLLLLIDFNLKLVRHMQTDPVPHLAARVL